MAPSSMATSRRRPSAVCSPETTILPGPSMLAFQSRPVGCDLCGRARRPWPRPAPARWSCRSGSATAGGLHGLAAATDDLETRLEIHRRRRTPAPCIRPGSDRPPPRRPRRPPGSVGFEALESGQAGDEDRRLADVGRFECIGRALEAKGSQVEAQDLAGSVEQCS